MKILALQGSPRKKGNTNRILDEMIKGAQDNGHEVIKYYSEQASNYKYYDTPYCDEDGNIYYWAAEASWNENGELITAKNDPTVE